MIRTSYAVGIVTSIIVFSYLLHYFSHKIISVKEQKQCSGVVVCFGDSLTEGLYNTKKWLKHPYTIRLQKLLNEFKFQNDCKLKVINHGVSGDLAANMKERFLGSLTDKPYFVIILAGTNDFLTMVSKTSSLQRNQVRAAVPFLKIASINKLNQTLDKSVRNIYENVTLLHKLAYQRNINTVLLTIPEISFERSNIYQLILLKHNMLNKRLKIFAEENKDQTVVVDFASMIPLLRLNLDEEKLWWADGLHLTENGYDRLGEIVFDAIKENQLILLPN